MGNAEEEVNEEHEGAIKKGRKRSRNPENWSRNIQKVKINSGAEYVSRLGKVHKAKQLKAPCNNCIFQCNEKINIESRQLLLQNFYLLGDKTRQRDFVSKCMTSISPKQNKSARKRLINKAYYFTVEGKKIRVCKKFFTSTLSISNNSITTVIAKTNETGYVEDEKRGKHNNRVNKTDESKIEEIVSHINLFPRIESHYCRARTKKEYLDGSLNLSIMYRLYVEKSQEEGKQFVKKPIYENIFNTRFNIGFHKPKKDQCSTCEAFRNAPGKDSSFNMEEHEKHLKDVKLARAEKQKDKEICKENLDVATCCYDLQAVMTLPQGSTAKFYYKSKLNVFNFTIFDLFEKKGYCYFWHEGIAKRGANEITTSVYLFLKDVLSNQKRQVIFYSDNCVAQNKNKFLFCMYLYCVEHLDIHSITHKYLVVGHTENEGDSMHACIEKEKARILKSGPICVPTELVTVIKGAKKSGHPYRVVQMHSESFINWKRIAEMMGRNFNLNTENEKVVWSQVKVVKVCKKEQDTIFYKTRFEDEEFKKICIRQKARSARPQVSLEPCYTGPVSIPAKKKVHLMQLCDEMQVPKVHHDFFKNLKAADRINNELESSDDEIV